MNLEHLLKIALEASIEAGNAIMEIYNSDDFDVQVKSDDSPLTKADLAAHNIIIKYLKATGIPILSEEDADISYETRSQWETFWLVDPLDGTKEFIKKNDEFTVNIALVINEVPTMGVVYLPVFNSVYFGAEGLGSFYQPGVEITKLDNICKEARKLPKSLPETYTVVGSRSHMNEDTQAYFSDLEKEHGTLNVISKGSSLKLCMVAEGSAHEYPRFGPTMEWDTGAGHAVALFSGAKVTESDKVSPLTYNKQNLLNPYFIVSR